MASPFYVEPLGGFNAGDIVGNAISQYKQNQAQEDQMAQQQDFMARTQEILSLADSGDYSRVPELLETNPDLFNIIRREQQSKRAGVAEQDRQVAQQAENEFDSLLLTSDESELPALIARAKANPLIDFDEEDEAMSLPQLKTMASLRLASNAPEFFKTLQSQPQVKTQVVQTPTGSQVINQQTGEVIRNVENPEKRQQFELNQKERTQKLKTQERKEKADIKKAKIAERDATQARQDTVQSGARAFALTNELLEEGVIEDVTGKLDRFGASIGLQTGVEGDILNKANQLKDLMTLENLSLMKGPLTDSDIKILASAASGLNIDENGFVGSTKGVTNQIKKIQSMLDMKLKSAVKRGDLSQLEYERIINPQSQQDGFSSLWGG